MSVKHFSTTPSAQGLYDPSNEHDACGVAFVATLTGVASNDIVAKGLTALRNLDHRGAVGGEPDTGDGAGILIQVPDKFLRAVGGVELPDPVLDPLLCRLEGGECEAELLAGDRIAARAHEELELVF